MYTGLRLPFGRSKFDSRAMKKFLPKFREAVQDSLKSAELAVKHERIHVEDILKSAELSIRHGADNIRAEASELVCENPISDESRRAIDHLTEVFEKFGKDTIHSATDARLSDAIPHFLRIFNSKQRYGAVTNTDSQGRNVLHKAASQNKPDFIEYVLESTDDDRKKRIFMNQDSEGKTVLHIAAECGSDSVVYVVLNSIQPEERLELALLKDGKGQTFLHLAVQSIPINYASIKFALDLLQPNDVPRLLIEKDHNGYTLLHLAAEIGSSDVFRLVLDKLEINDLVELVFNTDNHGRTVLHMAAATDHISEIYLLLCKHGLRSHMNGLLEKEDSSGRKVMEMVNLDSRKVMNMLTNTNEYYSLDNPPTVFIMYATKERELLAEEEFQSILGTFKCFKLNPVIVKDPTTQNIIQAIVDCRAVSAVSALILVTMSHGTAGMIKAADGLLPIQSILDIMSCSTPAGVPKVLVVQACQNSDTNTSAFDPVPSPYTPAPDARALPTIDIKNRDVAVLMATVRGQYAERNLMIPLLADNLVKFDGDMYDAFLKTNDEIKERSRLETPGQIALFQSSMTKKLNLTYSALVNS